MYVFEDKKVHTSFQNFHFIVIKKFLIDDTPKNINT